MIHFSVIEPGEKPGTNITIQIKIVNEPCESCNTPIVERAYFTIDNGVYSTRSLVKLRNFLNQLNFGEE